ncbi:Nuclear transcription factor Y subunit B-6 [Linum perenne]
MERHAPPTPAGGFHGYRSTTTTRAPRPSSPTGKVAGEMSMMMMMRNNNNNNKAINNNNESGVGEQECTVREQDRFMPIANVIRIMRKILPPHAKISDDAKETIQECVSEYISFITSEANERCQREQRKTITAEDVLFAMSKLGFDDYIEPLTLYLHRFRDLEGCDRASAPSSSSSSSSRIMEYLSSSSSGGFYGGGAYGSHSHVSIPLPRGNGTSNGSHDDHPLFGGNNNNN